MVRLSIDWKIIRARGKIRHGEYIRRRINKNMFFFSNLIPEIAFVSFIKNTLFLKAIKCTNTHEGRLISIKVFSGKNGRKANIWETAVEGEATCC